MIHSSISHYLRYMCITAYTVLIVTHTCTQIQYYIYSKALQDLSSSITELEQLHQEEVTLQQLATYCAITAAGCTPVLEGILELSRNC